MFPGTRAVGVILEPTDTEMYESAYEVVRHSPLMTRISEAKVSSTVCRLYGEVCNEGLFVSERMTNRMIRVIESAVTVLRGDHRDYFAAITPIVDTSLHDTTEILEIIGGELDHTQYLIGTYSDFARGLINTLHSSARLLKKL